MAYKRIIGALTVKDSRVVKSYGYSGWRPAGRLSTALKNLDRWEVDEIVVIDISRRPGLDPMVLRDIAAAKISTPLAYGGGIRTTDDVVTLMQLGCDRFLIESLLFGGGEELAKITELAGRQALIGSVPLTMDNGHYSVWCPTPDTLRPERCGVSLLQQFLFEKGISEFLITAVDAEGHAGQFPTELIELFSALPEASVIWFGGLNLEAAKKCLSSSVTAAIAVGNPNHETELLLPGYRSAILRDTGSASVRATRKARE